MSVDRRKKLTELEGRDWGPPEFDSHLVTTIHQLRHKPVEQFTVEDLRVAVGQNIALQWLLPIAIERLQDDPLAEGDFYQGDMLNGVLRIEPRFWLKHPELREIVAKTAKRAAACHQELTADEVQALETKLRAFGLSDPHETGRSGTRP